MRKISILMVVILIVSSATASSLTRSEIVSNVKDNTVSFEMSTEKEQEVKLQKLDWDYEHGRQFTTHGRKKSLNNFIESILIDGRKRSLPFSLTVKGTVTVELKLDIPKELEDQFLWGGLGIIPKEKKGDGTIGVKRRSLHKVYYEPGEPEMPIISMKEKEQEIIIEIKGRGKKRIYAAKKDVFFRTISKKGVTKDKPLGKSLLILPGRKLILRVPKEKFRTDTEELNIQFGIPMGDKIAAQKMTIS